MPDLRQEYETQEHVRRLIDTARGVEGNTRHASTNAAGVIVSDVPLVPYCPLNRPTRGGDGGDEIGVVTQYVWEELDELGLLKIDFLGLATLTIMRRACELIRRRHGVDLNFVGVIINRGHNYTQMEKERSSYWAAKMARFVNADGVILTENDFLEAVF